MSKVQNCKSKLEKTLNEIKKYKYYFYALLGFAFFHKPIEDLIDNYPVGYVFSKIDSSIWNDIIIGIVIIFIIGYYCRKLRYYFRLFNFPIHILSCGLIYSYYRCFSNLWMLTPFHCNHLESFYYLDIILVLTVVNIILWLINKCWLWIKQIGLWGYKYCAKLYSLLSSFISEKKKSISSEIKTDVKYTLPFFQDEPINNIDSDNLRFSKYVKMLVEKIEVSKFDSAFAIGINGKWGSGKTSFINLMKRDLIRPENIIVDFNPWMCKTPKAIIQEFFDTVQEKIGYYHSPLSSLLVRYSNRLVALNDNNISKSLQTIINAYTGNKTLKSLFDGINESLKKVNKKLIIFIDDTDRLDAEEIIEILRLIRNTANFHNTFFIVAYDRNYFVNALKQHNSYNHEQYLEKIFQLEINLPYYHKDILRETLISILNNNIPNINIHNYSINYLPRWIANMRDVTRLANSISLNYTKLKGEVVADDFIKLEILRFKFPDVYELLYKQPDVFFLKNDFSIESETYSLFVLKTASLDNLSKTSIEEFLRKNNSLHSVPEYYISDVCEFLVNIFQKRITQDYHLSVVMRDRFHIYFTYNLFEMDLSEEEFNSALSKNQEILNNQIKFWLENGLKEGLISRLEKKNEYKDMDEFKKIITSIVYIYNYENTLIHRLSPSIIKKTKEYSNLETTNIEELKNYIISFFENATYPFNLETYLINNIRKVLNYEFPLSLEELRTISIRYLKKYCNEAEKFGYEVYFLIYNCNTRNIIYGSDSDNLKLPDEAKTILIPFIKKDLDGFLYTLIDFSFENKISLKLNLPIEIFGGKEEFEIFLNNQDVNKWQYLKEFREIFNESKENDFKTPITFDLKDILRKIN